MGSFTEHFWGEKNNGFDVLYHNMKYGQESSKEFYDFLRESCTAEEAYSKSLAKLAKQANNSGSKGSFGPYWQVLKGLTDKLSSIHLQLVSAWQDLMKDVQKYSDEQSKKHKAVKDQESSTLETVHSMQQTIVLLQKAKETYHARCGEYEKCKRDSNSQKDIEKAEAKFKKANDEYRQLVDKYANVRNDFDTKMIESCKRFQDMEENHLKQMKEFINSYTKAWESQHALVTQIHQEFGANNSSLAVEKLLEMFISSKTTGTEKPGPIEFEEADISILAPVAGTPDLEQKDLTSTDKNKKESTVDNLSQGSPDSTSKPGPVFGLLDRTLPIRASGGWFLRSKRKEKKKKKKEKDKEKDNCSLEFEKNHVPQVDEEGFSIRPPTENHDSTSGSSDSESDTEDKRLAKIQVKIKPISPNGMPAANTEEIVKSIGAIRLSPSTNRRTPTMESNMTRSISVTDTMNFTVTKPSEDLLGLDLLAPGSSASTPTGGNYNFPSPMGHDISGGSLFSTGSTMTTPVSTPIDDRIGLRSDTPPVLPPKQRSQTPTMGAPLIPGPPPRNLSRTNLPALATSRPTGRQSPAMVTTTSFNSMNRAESVPSLNNFNTSSSSWSSRGPSPLTIGLSDTIPLAVAFSETVNACFKGTDDDKCQMKTTGDMMLSFPAGIVRVLTENPHPSSLSFRVRNTTSLEHILVNKQLVQEDLSQSGLDNKLYNFEMPLLIDHLRRQSEQNKTASYFNIDILKYQIKAKPGVKGVPLQLMAYWKCDPTTTELRLDYLYNSAAIPLRTSLSNCSVIANIDGGVLDMKSKPTATWLADTKRVKWTLGDVSDMNEAGGTGSLRARFKLEEGPSKPNTIAVQFLSEGTTLSGIDFDLIGAGYRVSLVKKRFITGKYISEPDREVKYV